MGKYHFIGVGGIGQSALALIMAERGYRVTGSDIAESYITEGLRKKGIALFSGHSGGCVTSDMTVVYNSDIDCDNPELVAAKKFKCPILHRSDLLAELSREKKTLAVAGSHGKTTVSALLSWTLKESGYAPSYAVGGIIKGLNKNGASDRGELLVIEACESDATFLKYDTESAIVTNIGLEHMEFYKSEAALVAAFSGFMAKVKKALYYCGDDQRLRKIAPLGISYGFSEGCLARVKNVVVSSFSTRFDITYRGQHFADIVLSAVGEHNALNAVPCFCLALDLGADEDRIRAAFRGFQGVKRRMDIKGKVANTLFIDDYAHHPAEIEVTLRALRAAYGKEKILVVYQPHRFSRTKNTLGQYGEVFADCDSVVITDIYASGEKPVAGVVAERVAEEVSGAQYIPFRRLPRFLADEVPGFDICVTMGAGSVTGIGPQVMEMLSDGRK